VKCKDDVRSVDDTLRTCEAYLMVFPESTIVTEAVICDTHYINLREMNCNCAFL
jgi:hypothetical protein